MSSKVAEIVTQKIIEQLEAGVVPWEKPWTTERQANYKTKDAYRGFNQWVLQLTAEARGFTSPYWLTKNNIHELGGHVADYKDNTNIIFYAKVKKSKRALSELKEKENDKYMLMRFYDVYNADQVIGVDFPKPEAIEINKPEADKVCNDYIVREGISLTTSQQASYNPILDRLSMPRLDQFKSEAGYYSTYFHELTHSTGHEKRLNRLEKTAHFGNEEYSKEELIAELGASILCHTTNVKRDTKQSASYIASWLKVLKNDRNMIISASSKAEKAVDYIMDNKA